ncbi:GATA transcription factor 21-like [Abrus precatorius]|uniref:GATA transcription factor 21-like n=1 Tax=Abrus precatorius TaxID=3816 RepID=A0A8B8K699_ABRPR|nr:GATA transcription factor 21-like [Abrus precatorius]
MFYVYESMTPTDCYSVSSPMPLDLNEDRTHQLFSANHQASSSSSSLSYSIFFNPDIDQGGSCYWESKHLQSDEEAKKIIPSSRSWDHPSAEKDERISDLKVMVWKKEDGYENLQREDSSVKWMPSKMRMMRRMMVSGFDIVGTSKKYEEKKSLLSPQEVYYSSNNSSSNNSNIPVRVCSDCQTTKTPLWRSGPKGPKSLCNACGIRQRKARHAIAAAANANGTILMDAKNEKSHVKKGSKFRNKGTKKSKTECTPQLKKKRKLGAKACVDRKRFNTFEDLTISLSKNLAFQQVFPKEEKEAAILLMALSYGLLHGFPSDRYL